MEKEIRNDNVAQDEEIESKNVTTETEELESPDTKIQFPIAGVIIISVLVVAIITVIILLYAFGGPIPKGSN